MFDHILDQESLDGLVLGNASGAVCASDWLDVSTTRFVSASISSLCSHLEGSSDWLDWKWG
jgi:hypothetical protein